MLDSVRTWFQPPRHLIAMFVLVTCIPSLLLVMFGWRLLQQDRQIERQRQDDRREQTADLIVSALEQAIAGTEERIRLGDFASVPLTSDSVIVVVSDDEIASIPAHRLPYVPVTRPGRDAGDLLARGEEIEHREQDPARAAAWFQRHTRAADPALRAAAFFVLGRTLRKLGHVEPALDAYSHAMSTTGAAIGGMPVDLVARVARCDLLSQLGRMTELRAEARELRRLLLDGRWPVNRPAFFLNLEQATRWSGDDEPADRIRLALSAVAENLWTDWKRTGGAPRRQLVDEGGMPFTVLSSTREGTLTALIAGPGLMEDQWTSRVQGLIAGAGVTLDIREASFKHETGSSIRRGAGETGLPWTLVVSDTASGDRAMLSGRGTVWLGGLVILGALVAGGTYLVGRAVSRELAVARVQTDFVAAVSHEFRTPLTSLRQLSEMLVDRPDAPPDRRRAYYEALQRQTTRLHRLVEGLLDFGRMEDGSTPYRFESMEAGAFVRKTAEEFSTDPAARCHAIQVSAALPAWIDADREAMANVLWNLLDNAAKYSPGDPTIDVSVTAEGRQVAIRVSDHGFGIPADEQRDVFRKFVRGSRAKAEGIGGTGIGLATVHHVVSAHGGKVEIVSAPGKGTTICVLLPISKHVEDGKTVPCLES